MLKLKDKVTKLPQVGPFYAQKLEKLNIATIEELLLHVPSRYLDFRNKLDINKARVGQTVVVKGKLTFIKNQYTKGGKKIQIGNIEDNSGKITLIWFNQPYLVRTIHKGNILQIAGQVGWFGREKAFISPEFEKLEEGKEGMHTQGLVPIYPETSGVSSKWLRNRIRSAYGLVSSSFKEFLPKGLLQEENLIDYQTAITFIHFPKNLESSQKARKRLALNELIFFHLKSLYKKRDWQKNRVVKPLAIDNKKIKEFISHFPFSLTLSQIRSSEEILNDLKKTIPMNRLLEGDVGSGKTVVGAIACFVCFLNGFQTIIMAPTQILAQQHYLTLKKLFQNYKIRISLITSEVRISDIGKADLFIGTHALLHNKVADFDNVSLVIIDEQHRFGVEQRAGLIRKVKLTHLAPHVLTMTATPIPRTIALTFYGDLDLSTLDELPFGRIPTTTWIIPPAKRKASYLWIKEKIKNESVQVFIICPLIEESQVETMKDVKAVKAEFTKLKKIFKEFRVDLLHGKQKAQEKNKIIQNFKKGKTDILVSTPVVEVGIDIPNANIMLIEGAERFGLSTLHQLRGRVGRGTKKSYCLLYTEIKSGKVLTRLNALRKEKSGFKLAEIDLKLRGPGEIFGFRQHGFPELKIASWQDIALIKKAKNIAQEALKNKQKFANLNKKLKNIPYISN